MTRTAAATAPTNLGSSSLKDIIAGGSGNNNDNSYEGNGSGTEGNNCTKFTIPTLTTQASSATSGSPISDQAFLSGTGGATGTITWNVYKASDTSCATPLNTANQFVDNASGDGTYTSPNWTPAAGTYQWVATFKPSSSGSVATISTSCNDPKEVSTVSPAKPAIVTNATSGTVGQTIYDTATISGGTTPSGSVTWSLYGPNDSTCGSAPVATEGPVTVNGDGTIQSPTYTTTATGTFRWVAAYTGDANNAAISTKCNDPNEESTVSKASPGLVTNATTPVTVGGTIQDSATLSGSYSATGTITWKLYGPGDTACGTALSTSTPLSVSVTGDGTYQSPTYTATSTGVYRWVATYSGDANNNSVSGKCNDPNEESTVNPAVPTLTTNAVSGIAGQPIHDVAHLTGGDSPTGTIVWHVYNSSTDAGCTTPLEPSAISVTVNGDGDYTSPNYTPANQGTYEWVATYSGDGNNVKLTTSCTDPNEVSTVSVSPAPAISLIKLERIGSSGSFTHGPVTGNVGDTVNYEINITDTGNTPLTLQFTDAQCASGTLSGPVVLNGGYNGTTQTLAVGGEVQYTCSHVLAAGDQPFTNTASVIGTPPPNEGNPVNASDSVQAFANTPGMQVVKLERDASTGGTSFSSGPITGSVGDTIDYEIQVTNTGNTTLALSLSDPHCDAGTIQGPSSVSGTLNGNTLSAGGVAQYTCSHVLAAGDIPQFTNVATVTGQPPTGPPLSGTSTVVVNVTQAGMQVVKLERDATAGGTSFTSGPITGDVGDTIDYEIQVTNTGNTTLALSLNDPHCDAGTIQGPSAVSGTLNGLTLSAGGVAQYTCSHVLAAGDVPQFTNVATVTGQPPTGPPISGTSTVVVNVDIPGLQVVKLQRDGTTGSFTSSTITAKVGDTIEYEIQATNTGSAPLTLSINDPHCDAGTLAGPFLVSGSLSGDVLAAGGEAQYTCSHVLSATDTTPFTNVATVTGTPPSGTPVSGTAQVTANKAAVKRIIVKRCPAGKVKKTTKNKKGKKVVACVAKKLPRPPKHVSGFTG